MKSIKYVIPVLALLAAAFVFSGCPGKNMMSDDGMKQEDSMTSDNMETQDMTSDDGMQKDAMMEK